MNYIAVEERLPDHNEDVLVKYPNILGDGQMVANYDTSSESWYDYRGEVVNLSVYRITHWKNLED